MKKYVSLLIFSVFLLLPSKVFAASQVVINEIYYDPPGSDSTYEFLELYNSGDTDICIGGWDIQVAGTSFSTIGISIPDNHLIKAKSYYLIAGQENAGGFGGSADLTDSNLSMQNGGNETDGVRIRNTDNEIIDTILYDETNTNNLPDDTADSANSFAVDVNEGHSLQRTIAGKDTNKSGDDFEDQTTPSPEGGEKGSCPANPTPSPQATTPSPQASPKSTTKSTVSSKKSPSPSPKPTDNQAKNVLGEKIEISTPSANLSMNYQDSPPPTAGYTQESSQKIAGIFIGVGSVLVAISLAVYLWYKRLQDKPTINKEKDRFEENKVDN